MPREIIHWMVIEESLKRLHKQDPLLSVISKHLDFALLGSVMPDAPYYCSLGASQPALQLGSILHGKGRQDTFQLPRKGLQVCLKSGSLTREDVSKQCAFWLGYLSHCLTDMAFHPFVYFFTGDYDHPDPHEREQARARHRVLEVLMDLAFLEQAPHLKEKSIASLAATTASSVSQWLGEASIALFPNAENQAPSSLWQQSIAGLATCQKLFNSKLIGWSIRGLTKVGVNKLDEYEALFLAGKDSETLQPDIVVHYRNPVTGALLTASLQQLLQQAVERTLATWKLCAAYFEKTASQSLCSLLPEAGASLAFDVVGSKAADARYFSDTFLQGLIAKHQTARIHSTPQHTSFATRTECDFEDGFILAPKGAARAGVLLFHGITGSPRELKRLATLLQEQGLLVSVPRLKGHSTTLEELQKTTSSEWLEQSWESYQELTRQCNGQVFVGGLSFGALLALRLAGEATVPPLGCLTFSPPLVLRNNSNQQLLKWLALLVPDKFMPSFPLRKKTLRQLNYLAFEHNAYPAHSVSASIRLFKIRRRILKVLPTIRCPVFLAFDPEDHLVDSRRSAALFRNLFSKQQLTECILRGGEHELPLGHRHRDLEDQVQKYINQILAT